MDVTPTFSDKTSEQTPVAQPVADTSHNSALSFENFTFTYAQDPHHEQPQDRLTSPSSINQSATIGPITWSVPQGSFVLLTGSTGSGKTTLLRSCKPELAPTGIKTGTIRVQGHPVTSLDLLTSAQTIAYVAQNPENQQTCDSVWHELAFACENVGMPQEIMRIRIAEVAHFFGIEQWFRSSVTTLSGGEKQILNLASALVLRPSILLLDEPTAQLDPVAEKTFLHALFRLNRELGLTIVVATHRAPAMIDYATQAAHIENGTVQPLDIRHLREEIPSWNGPSFRNDPPQATTETAVALHDVYAQYNRTDPFILHQLDLSITYQSIHAIIGANGSGKTTLLNVITHTLKPRRGRVENKALHSQALLPQDPRTLFVCDSVKEELAEWQASCGYSTDDIELMLKTIHLDHRATNHPYDLSGGEQQLLALAKLALTQPDLLLLDEPTKGLDAHAKHLAATILDQLYQRHHTTIVMATHDLAFARAFAHTITLLFDGGAACTQSVSEFFAHSFFYQAIPDTFATLWDDQQ